MDKFQDKANQGMFSKRKKFPSNWLEKISSNLLRNHQHLLN